MRAKEVGLEEPALAILDNKNINLFDYVTTENKELSTVDVIEKGIIHIFASIIATDTSILSDLRELYLIFFFIACSYIIMFSDVKGLILK